MTRDHGDRLDALDALDALGGSEPRDGSRSFDSSTSENSDIHPSSALAREGPSGPRVASVARIRRSRPGTVSRERGGSWPPATSTRIVGVDDPGADAGVAAHEDDDDDEAGFALDADPEAV